MPSRINTKKTPKHNLSLTLTTFWEEGGCGERNSEWLPDRRLNLQTALGALPGNPNCDLWCVGQHSNQLSHTSQGRRKFLKTKTKFFKASRKIKIRTLPTLAQAQKRLHSYWNDGGPGRKTVTCGFSDQWEMKVKQTHFQINRCWVSRCWSIPSVRNAGGSSRGGRGSMPGKHEPTRRAGEPCKRERVCKQERLQFACLQAFTDNWTFKAKIIMYYQTYNTSTINYMQQ